MGRERGISAKDAKDAKKNDSGASARYSDEKPTAPESSQILGDNRGLNPSAAFASFALIILPLRFRRLHGEWRRERAGGSSRGSAEESFRA